MTIAPRCSNVRLLKLHLRALKMNRHFWKWDFGGNVQICATSTTTPDIRNISSTNWFWPFFAKEHPWAEVTTHHWKNTWCHKVMCDYNQDKAANSIHRGRPWDRVERLGKHLKTDLQSRLFWWRGSRLLLQSNRLAREALQHWLDNFLHFPLNNKATSECL